MGNLNLESDSAGKLLIISGPSGVGKSTCVKRLIETCELPLELSVSVTTRPKRPNEVDGRDYQFISEDKFKELETQGAFLETAEVFGVGHQYGTLFEPVTTGLKQGKWIILEVDVIGAAKVIKEYPEVISIFIYQSLEEIEARLRGRETESEDAILRRLEVAASELEVKELYQHQVLNQEVQLTADKICKLLQEACPKCQAKAQNTSGE